MVSHRDASVVGTKRQMPGDTFLCQSLLHQQFAVTGRRYISLVVLLDGKELRRRQKLDSGKLSCFIGDNPVQRLSDVGEVLIGIPRHRALVEEQVRLLTKIDEV